MLGKNKHNEPGMGLIKLRWATETVDIELECDDSIPTCDLLEVIETFIRLMERNPSGNLEFIQDKV